ncbi:ROK family protein [Roseibacillus ishigakijimensis]|uniref:ROK family protein n=1 Tax=Roseibacillus ishigakijimensis TaxID=454146 RepID=A0A934RPW2_9BACT|nr:ROK family protein [Roseibacillus ishigakijimensis]MBK1834773.1 ROK family protein [Roseibacillus ishigakijimensis]
MPNSPQNDSRSVMTLDAGGTSFKFSAMQGGKPAIASFSLPSNTHELTACLQTLVAGFERVRAELATPPSAISFAFPGPCDYRHGIVGDLPNLPCFRGGVPLAPFLENHFGLPTFLNNDGDLFVYGESMAGLLPEVNARLAQAGSPKRYRNLCGVTLGTGFGGGIVIDGHLLRGDNVSGGEVWLMRNKLHPESNAEEGACIRAVQRSFSEKCGLPLAEAPSPKDIAELARQSDHPQAEAARWAYQQLGEVVGDTLAQLVTLTDGLVVIGGGLSGAADLFLPALLAEMNGTYRSPAGEDFPRLVQEACNLEEEASYQHFLQGETRAIAIPGSNETLPYDPLPRSGIGITRLGTSEAVAIGAYAYALDQLS